MSATNEKRIEIEEAPDRNETYFSVGLSAPTAPSILVKPDGTVWLSVDGKLCQETDPVVIGCAFLTWAKAMAKTTATEPLP